MTRLRLGSGLVMALAFLSGGGTSLSAEEAAHCAAPVELTRSLYPLSRLSRALATDGPTAILVLNSATQPRRSTAKEGEAVPRAFPIFVEEWLRAAFPDGGVSVITRTVPRATAETMLETLPATLVEVNPALVIWQTGTYDAILGADLAGFARAVDQGIDMVRSAGSDVILVSPQFSPRTSFAFSFDLYAENLRWTARYGEAPFFDRYGVMRFWDETGSFDVDASNPSPSLYEDVHRCIGWLLTGLIQDGINTATAVSVR